jgi:hypothetical protein
MSGGSWEDNLTDDGFTFLMAGFRPDIVEQEDNHTMFDPIRMFCRERVRNVDVKQPFHEVLKQIGFDEHSAALLSDSPHVAPDETLEEWLVNLLVSVKFELASRGAVDDCGNAYTCLHRFTRPLEEKPIQDHHPNDEHKSLDAFKRE